MYQFRPEKILIPVDFSDTSLLAIRHGVFVARFTRAELFLLHVVNLHYETQDLFLPYVQVDRSEVENKAMQKLEGLAEEIQQEFNIQPTCLIRTGSPSFEILHVAEELGISLITMGTHGYGPLQELIIGSVALKVLTKSPCPTMAMSVAAEQKGYSRILLPIDTSAHTRQKVNYAVELAHSFKASIEIVGLLGANEDKEKPAMELILKQVEGIANELKVSHHTALLEKVKNRATATVEHANTSGADLILIMSDQDAELTGLFLGPYAQQIIHNSKVPVLALRPKDLSVNAANILGGTSGI